MRKLKLTHTCIEERSDELAGRGGISVESILSEFVFLQNLPQKPFFSGANLYFIRFDARCSALSI